MLKSLKLVIGAAMGILLVGLTVIQLGNFETRRLRSRIDELERDRTELVHFAERLSASRRVAQVTVVRQRTDESGRPIHDLTWQEIRPNGLLEETLTLAIVGRQAYFEAFVIKFTHTHVGEGDPERGTSLALFRRVFGDGQASETVAQFDRTLRLVDPAGAGSSPQPSELWQRFWELVDDPRSAARYGVRVAQIEAPAIPLRVGHVWEVTLDAAGGLNLRKLEPDEIVSQGRP